MSLIPESGRSPGGGFGNPLQSSCLENHMEIGVWWAIVHGTAKSRAQLKLLSMHKLCNILFVSCCVCVCVCVCVIAVVVLSIDYELCNKHGFR